MKGKLFALAPYAVLLAVDFYLLPLWMNSTGTAMLFMLCVMPLIAFIAAVVCGLCQGFCPLLCPLAFFLFFPTVFIYYNASAWVYAVFYAVLVLAGNGVGRAFYGKR